MRLRSSLLPLVAAAVFSALALLVPVDPDSPMAQAANTQAFGRVIDLGQDVKMLMGQGGNMAMLGGPDGLFVVDDQFTTNAEANLAKIEEIAKAKPKFLVNTHWHFDHMGGNAVFAKAGATIFASDNSRKRMSGQITSLELTGQPRRTWAKEFWPVVTFKDGIDFHLNGQTIRVIKAPAPTHTDGDVMIYFVEADVLHMGDTYTKDGYPLVDTPSNGTQAGHIATFKRVLELTGPNTKYIPGHGELANRDDVVATLAMHEGARAAVEKAVKSGATLQQTIAARPLAQWTPRFGRPGNFASEDAFVTVIYNELKKSQPQA